MTCCWRTFVVLLAFLAASRNSLASDSQDSQQSLKSLTAACNAILASGIVRDIRESPCHAAVKAAESVDSGNQTLPGALDRLGRFYVEMGHFEEAEKYFLRARDLLESRLGNSHPSVGISLNGLGMLYGRMGRYKEAEDVLRKSLLIAESAYGIEHSSAGIVLGNLAEVFRIQGKFIEAEPLSLRSIAISEKSLGRNHLDVATARNNLGVIYLEGSRYAEAEAQLRLSLPILSASYGENHPLVATAEQNLAVALSNLGKLDEAEQLFRQSFEARVKALGPNHLDVAQSYEHLADIENRKGNHIAAAGYILDELEIKEKLLGATHPEVAKSLNRLAIQYVSLKLGNEALASFRKATEIYKKRMLLLPDDLVASDLLRNRPGFLSHIWTLSAFYLRNPDPPIAEEAFTITQLLQASSTASTTGEVMAQAGVRFAAKTPLLAKIVRERQDYFTLWKKLDRQLVESFARPAAQRNLEEESKLRHRMEAGEELVRRRDAQLLREFPEYRELTNPEPLPLADVQKLLGPEEALVSWLVLEKETYLFLVRADHIEFVSIDAGQRQIGQLVHRLRNATEIPETGDLPDFPYDKANELYRLLFGSIEKHLQGIKHLVLIPDGPLQSLSFGLITIGAGRTAEDKPSDVSWLARQYTLTTLPAITSLRAIRTSVKTPGQREPFIGFGDPTLKGSSSDKRGFKIARLFSRGRVADTRAVAEMQPLPDTADELRTIAKTLHAGNNTIYLRDAATETQVKKATLSRYRVVAFATHGLMAGEFGGIQEPALVLTPPANGSEDDDGLLTASEVAGLKLDADWVILSACNTAAPDGSPGAGGFTGLTKSFFYAGARTLLVSHWAVESKSAKAITTRLFEETEKGATKAEALRRAMMALADDPETAHPAYWAPFVVVGEGSR